MTKTRVLFASLIGTTIEFFDFYIYGTAAVLVFPKLFFPPGNATAATLQSLATFALAFFARPIGSALFGHFGDRIGRKATLVAALLTMGLSTVAIGLLGILTRFHLANRKMTIAVNGEVRQEFIEEMKASGFVAKAIANNNIRGLTVAAPAARWP
mgnify:CR=1 FL=1